MRVLIFTVLMFSLTLLALPYGSLPNHSWATCYNHFIPICTDDGGGDRPGTCGRGGQSGGYSNNGSASYQAGTAGGNDTLPAFQSPNNANISPSGQAGGGDSSDSMDFCPDGHCRMGVIQGILDGNLYTQNVGDGRYEAFPFLKRKLFSFPVVGDFDLGPVIYYGGDWGRTATNFDPEGKATFGDRWSLNYQLRLSQATNGDLVFTDHAGNWHPLDKLDSTHWTAYENSAIIATVTFTGSYYFMKGPDGHPTMKFRVDGRPLYLQDRNGSYLNFYYQESGDPDLLVKIQSSRDTSQYITFEYDANKKLTSITQPDGKKVQFGYNTYGYLETIKDNSGNIWEKYSYDADTPNITEIRRRNHDGNLRVAEKFVWTWLDDPVNGNVVEKKYDGENNLILQRQWDGSTAGFLIYGDLLIDLEMTTYLPKKVFFKDSEGNTTKWRAQNFPTSNFFRPTDFEDSSGNKTSFTYDDGQGDFGYAFVKKITYPDDDSNPNNNPYVEYSYNDDYQVTQFRNTNGRSTWYEYDSKGNLTKVKRYWTEGAKWVTTAYEYDGCGRLTEVEIKDPDDDSFTTTYQYNSRGQVTKVTDFNGLSTEFTYASNGLLTQVKDPKGKYTYFYHDSRNRMHKVKDALQNETLLTYTYNDLLESVTDPQNDRTLYTYDTRGHLSKVKQYNTGNVNDYVETTYLYNGRGLLSKVTDAENNDTEYLYDEEGRLTKEIDDVQNDIEYTYYDDSCNCNGVGRLASKTTPNGDTIEYEYDAHGRLTKIDYPGSDYVQFWYDSIGNLTKMYDSRLTIVNKTFEWSYDSLERLIEEKYPDGVYRVQYSYDCLSRPTEIQVVNNSGTVTKNAYHYYDNYTHSKLWPYSAGSTGISGIYYYSFNSSTGELGYAWWVSGGPQTFVTYAYDDLGRVTTVANRKDDGDGQIETTDPAIYVSDYHYLSDSNVDYVDVTHAEGSCKREYAYDYVKRLTSEYNKTSDGSTTNYYYTYEYDDVGNRTSMIHYDGSQTVTTNYNYNSLNQLTSWNNGSMTVTYQYDDNGNMVLRNRDCPLDDYYSYNYDARMADVDLREGMEKSVDLEYDVFGRLLLREDVDTGKIIKYFYAGTQVIYERYKPNSTASWTDHRAYLLQSGAVGHIIAFKDYPSGNSYKLHYDRMGNVMSKSDLDGTNATIYDQEAFGNNPDGDIAAGYHLTTKEYHDDLGLYYFYLRWYDPAIGRFTQKDPIVRGQLGNGQSWNPYHYVYNNPTSKYDPLGLMTMATPLGTAACCALADGPLPIGDAIGACVVIGGALYIYFIADSFSSCNGDEDIPCPPPPLTPEQCYDLYMDCVRGAQKGRSPREKAWKYGDCSNSYGDCVAKGVWNPPWWFNWDIPGIVGP